MKRGVAAERDPRGEAGKQKMTFLERSLLETALILGEAEGRLGGGNKT